MYLGDRMPYAASHPLPTTRIAVTGGEIVVGIAPGPLDLERAHLLDWIERSAQGVVARVLRSLPRAAHAAPRGAESGTGRERRSGLGHRGAAVRITIGERATEIEFARDWASVVDELTHLAFPSVPARHHWIEEGLASYVEPVARAQAGHLDPRAVWSELAAGLPKGLPQAGDRGLDHSYSAPASTGAGALFALLADLEILAPAPRTGSASATRSAGSSARGNIEWTGPPLEATARDR